MARSAVPVVALRRAADFEELLRTTPLRRSEHFVLHFRQCPSRDGTAAAAQKLSTVTDPSLDRSVDNNPAPAFAHPAQAEAGRQFGMIIPKRHARQAVTRNLLKRQVREALRRHAGGWPAGCWLVRLRTPFDRQVFRSAASRPLREAARTELERLLKPPPATTHAR